MTKEEIESVKNLGRRIGYGHMMNIASSLWRKENKEQGYSEASAFVTTCIGQFDEEGRVFFPYGNQIILMGAKVSPVQSAINILYGDKL